MKVTRSRWMEAAFIVASMAKAMLCYAHQCDDDDDLIKESFKRIIIIKL